MKTQTIKDQAAKAKALADAFSQAKHAANQADSALAIHEESLTKVKADRFKTPKARANQKERVAGLRKCIAEARIKARDAHTALRRAQKALDHGPKVYRLPIDADRARKAGAHLDMTGKDARVIPSLDESTIVREPAKHVWKGSQTEAYYSRSRSSDLEYVRAVRDNHITSFCVLSGQWARGVVHTTEWALKAPATMSWRIEEGKLAISAPPSRLAPTKGRFVLAPEDPALSGLELARRSYRAAYAEQRDPMFKRGPKVRLALRALSRHRKLGWKIGKEVFEGRDLAFAQRRDGEKYHFVSSTTSYTSSAITSLATTIQEAFDMRDRQKARAAEEAEQKAQLLRDLHNTRVTLEDSRKAGNCVEGSLAFAERKLHIPREQILSSGYLFSVSAETLLAVANGQTEQAMRAIRVAWLRETTVSI